MEKQKEHIPFQGLRCMKDDLIASLLSDCVFVNIVVGSNSYLFDVKSIKKVSGYYDFWRIDGYINGCESTLFIDYNTPDETYPIGGFGYLEIISNN